MNKCILFILCLSSQLLHADSKNQFIERRIYEQQITYQEELERRGLSTRYPSVINNIYDSAKEGFRDIHEGLWKLQDVFESYLLPNHTYNATPAFVRYAPKNELCYEELAFIQNRIPHVKEALEQFLDMELNEQDMPRIGLCFTGGGFRAMNLTLGFLKGAQEIGLFDSSMFMASLSGSTWAVAPWIATDQSMDVYMNELSKNIETGLNLIDNPNEIRLLMQRLMVKMMYKQPLSAIDLYGAILGNTLLESYGNGRMSITLTESHKDVIMGFLPLPIYTSVQTNLRPYEWMECTPYEIGGDYLQSYIPTWAYGRKFQHGASLNYAPEQSLGYFMGIFGSAFEVDFKDIIAHSQSQLHEIKMELPAILQTPATDLINFIANSPLNDLRLFPSMLRNFTHNIQWSPVCNDKNICLVDAGIDFNIPFPPLLRPERKVDVIIVYDASYTIENSPELKHAAEYAWRKGLKFPKIDYETAGTEIVSIFKDKDPKTPIVIYFPRIPNPAYSDFNPNYCTVSSFCETTNFKYSQEQFDQLTGLSYFTIKQHTELIKSVLKEVVERKHSAQA